MTEYRSCVRKTSYHFIMEQTVAPRAPVCKGTGEARIRIIPTVPRLSITPDRLASTVYKPDHSCTCLPLIGQ